MTVKTNIKAGLRSNMNHSQSLKVRTGIKAGLSSNHSQTTRRTMAVTGLMLLGMVLGGLGTVGCDQLSAEQMAQVAAASGAQSVQSADCSFASYKTDARCSLPNDPDTRWHR